MPVGDPGNAADTTGYGAVAYKFQIGKYDVTNAQYGEFLNAKAASGDPRGLWNDSMSSDANGGINRSGSGPYKYAVKPGQGKPARRFRELVYRDPLCELVDQRPGQRRYGKRRL